MIFTAGRAYGWVEGMELALCYYYYFFLYLLPLKPVTKQEKNEKSERNKQTEEGNKEEEREETHTEGSCFCVVYLAIKSMLLVAFTDYYYYCYFY